MCVPTHVAIRMAALLVLFRIGHPGAFICTRRALRARSVSTLSLRPSGPATVSSGGGSGRAGGWATDMGTSTVAERTLCPAMALVFMVGVEAEAVILFDVPLTPPSFVELGLGCIRKVHTWVNDEW